MLYALYSLLFPWIKKKILLQDCKRTTGASEGDLLKITSRHIKQRALKSCRLMAQMFHQSLSDTVAMGYVCLLKLKSSESYRLSPVLAQPFCKQQPSFSLQYCSVSSIKQTRYRTSSKFCKYFIQLFSPFWKTQHFCKRTSSIVIFHEIPLSIDAYAPLLPQAVQGRLPQYPG